MSEGHDPKQDAPTAQMGAQPGEGGYDGELPIGGVLADRYQVLERL